MEWYYNKGTSDPYGVLHVYDKEYAQTPVKSPAKSKTLNPQWNYTFPDTIPLYPRWGKIGFVIEVFDKDLVGKDDYLGEAEFVLPETFKHQDSLELTQELKAGKGHENEKKISGSITVHVHFNCPMMAYHGASFTFTGAPAKIGASERQFPCRWTGKGTLDMLLGPKFTFTEITREQNSGETWTTTQELSAKINATYNNSSISVPKSETWKKDVEFIFKGAKMDPKDLHESIKLDVVDKCIDNILSSQILNLNDKLSGEYAAIWYLQIFISTS